MKIALDYDGTYTADPPLWDRFIRWARLGGHKVYIVTMRHAKDDTIDSIPEGVNGVVYCDGGRKKTVTESLGIDIAIWIDDNPEGIHVGSVYTDKELEAWRANGRK